MSTRASSHTVMKIGSDSTDNYFAIQSFVIGVSLKSKDCLFRIPIRRNWTKWLQQPGTIKFLQISKVLTQRFQRTFLMILLLFHSSNISFLLDPSSFATIPFSLYLFRKSFEMIRHETHEFVSFTSFLIDCLINLLLSEVERRFLQPSDRRETTQQCKILISIWGVAKPRESKAKEISDRRRDIKLGAFCLNEDYRELA